MAQSGPRSSPLTYAKLTPRFPRMLLSPSARMSSVLPGLPRGIAAGLRSAAGLPRPFAAPGEDVLSTGIAVLDQLLDGGLPRGALVEMNTMNAMSTRGASTGRFAFVLSALAAATQAGETAALVDLGDHLDPQLAEAEGVHLARLLWLRPRRLKDALAATETAVATGFALVVVDLGMGGMRGLNPHFCAAMWVRIARLAQAQHVAVLVASPHRVTGVAARTVLGAGSARPMWKGRGTGSLLAGLSTRLEVEKRRGGRPGEAARVSLALQDALLGAETMENTLEKELLRKELLREDQEESRMVASGAPASLSSTCP
jgi:recA bacterial DNA recombination protein